MRQFTPDEQWRSFQTFIAAYLAGMLHQRDVFTLSRREAVAPPLMEFRCEADGSLRFSIGDRAWSDDPDDVLVLRREEANEIARQAVQLLRDMDGIEEPRDIRASASGPASSVAVLARGGFFGGGSVHPARRDVYAARATADIDVDGDPIEAAAQEAGSRVFRATRSGSIAAMAAARELARLRAWFDPFSVAPSSGYQVGGS